MIFNLVIALIGAAFIAFDADANFMVVFVGFFTYLGIAYGVDCIVAGVRRLLGGKWYVRFLFWIRYSSYRNIFTV